MISSPPRPTVEFERSDDLHALTRARRDRVRFVHVPECSYLAVDGTEPPGSEAYAGAIATLYPAAYALHFALRRRGIHARVGMLEGLYWLTPEELLAGDDTGVRSDDYHWRWRLLLAVPDLASETEIETAIRDASDRGRLPALSRLRVLRWEEGPAAQILHVGSYAAETPTIRRLHAAIVAAGYEPHGQHHEIYLNDPRQVGEDNAKTVVRRPIRLPGEASVGG